MWTCEHISDYECDVLFKFRNAEIDKDSVKVWDKLIPNVLSYLICIVLQKNKQTILFFVA